MRGGQLMADIPFDPLSKPALAESIALQLQKSPALSFPPENKIVGAGIYALYYSGDFLPYQPIAKRNKGDKVQVPIYVGKAVPKGSRKGRVGLESMSGSALFGRLSKHAHSIENVANLNLADFKYRYVICEDVWITFCETMLIIRFKPLWNVFVEGFGINVPGAGREKQRKSMWDTLHPGRPEARRLPPNDKTAAELAESIAEFFAGKISPKIGAAEAAVKQD
jgi:hypothetical protein